MSSSKVRKSNNMDVRLQPEEKKLSSQVLSTYLNKVGETGKKLCDFLHCAKNAQVSLSSSQKLVDEVRSCGFLGDCQNVSDALSSLNQFVCLLGNLSNVKSNILALNGIDLLVDKLNAVSQLRSVCAVMARSNEIVRNSLEMRDQIIDASVMQEVRKTYMALRSTLYEALSKNSTHGIRLLGNNNNNDAGNANDQQDRNTDEHWLTNSTNLHNTLEQLTVYISNIYDSYSSVLNQFGDISHDPVGAVYAFELSVAVQVGADAIEYLNSLSSIQTKVINPLAASLVATVSAIAQAFTKVWTQLQNIVSSTSSQVPSLNNLPFIMNNSALMNMLNSMGSLGLSPYVQGLLLSNNKTAQIAPGTLLQFLNSNQEVVVSANCTLEPGDENNIGDLIGALNGVIMGQLKNPQLLLDWSHHGQTGYINTADGATYKSDINTVALFNQWGLTATCITSGPLDAINAMLTAMGLPYLLENQSGHPQLVIATSIFSGTGTKSPVPPTPGANPSDSLINALNQYCSAIGLGSALTCFEALQNIACVDLSNLYTKNPSQWTTQDLTDYSMTNLAYCGSVSDGSNFRLVFIDASVHYAHQPSNAIAIPHNLFELISQSEETNTYFYPNTSSSKWPYVSYQSVDAKGPIAYLSIGDMIDLFNQTLGIVGTFANVSGSATLFGENGIFANVATMQSQSQGSIQQLGSNVARAPDQAHSVATDILQELQTTRQELTTLVRSLISDAVI